MPTLPAFDPIAFLILSKFPLYGRLSHHHYGDDTGLPLKERKRQLKEINAYNSQLLALPPEELDELVRGEKEKRAHEQDAGRPFNRPCSAEDLGHWGTLLLWSLDEAIALSLGLDPQHASWMSIAPQVRVSPLAKKYSQLRERVSRAEQGGELSNPISPHKYMEWARRNMIEVSKVLAEEIVARTGRIQDYESICAANAKLTQRISELEAILTAESDKLGSGGANVVDRPLETRERESLQSILIACAIKPYNYSPSMRSAVPRQISEDLERLGLPLDEDTVRKHLAKAAELLRGDWQKRCRR
jgi:hypothetical protein